MNNNIFNAFKLKNNKIMFIDNREEQNSSIPNSTIFLNINDSIDFSPSKIDLMKYEQKSFTTNKIETCCNSCDKKTSKSLEEIPIYFPKSNSKSANKIISIPIKLNYTKKNENVKNLFQNDTTKENVNNDYTRIVCTTEIKELSISSTDSSKNKNNNFDYNEVIDPKMTNLSYIYNLDIKNDIQNLIDEISLFSQTENMQSNKNDINNNNEEESKNIDIKYQNKKNLVSIQELEDEEDENDEKDSKFNKKLNMTEKNKNTPIIFSSNFSQAFIHTKKFSYSPSINQNNIIDIDNDYNNSEEKNDSFINNNIIIKPIDTFISYNNEITSDDINGNVNSFFNESDINKFFISPSKKDKKQYKDHIYHTLNKLRTCDNKFNNNSSSSKKKLPNSTYIKKTIKKTDYQKNNDLSKLISPENLNKYYTYNFNNNFEITDFNILNKINKYKNFYKDDIKITKFDLFKNLNICVNKNNDIDYIEEQKLKNITKDNDKREKDSFFKEYNDCNNSLEKIAANQSNLFLTTTLNTSNLLNNFKEDTNFNKFSSSKEKEGKNCINDKDYNKKVSDFVINDKNKNIKNKYNKNIKNIEFKNSIFFSEIQDVEKNSDNKNFENNKKLFEKLGSSIEKIKQIENSSVIDKKLFNINREREDANEVKKSEQNNICNKKEKIFDGLKINNKNENIKINNLHIFSIESYENFIKDLLNKTFETISKIKKENINPRKNLIKNKDIGKYISSFENKLNLFRNYYLCFFVKKHYLPTKEEKLQLRTEFDIAFQRNTLFNNYISLIKITNENDDKLRNMIKIYKIIEKYGKINKNIIKQAKKIYKTEGELSPYSIKFINENEKNTKKKEIGYNNINKNNLDIKKAITVSSIVIPMLYLIEFLYKYIK